jgi:hypothetical protein
MAAISIQFNNTTRGEACLIQASKIKQRDWYVKSNKCKNAKVIKAMVKRYGQLQAILVRTNEAGETELIDGFEVLSALKDDGDKDVLCINFGSISKAEAMCIYIVTHFSGKKVAEEQLAEAVYELSKQYNGSKSLRNMLPLEADIIDDYVEMFEFIFENFIKPKQSEQYSMF